MLDGILNTPLTYSDILCLAEIIFTVVQSFMSIFLDFLGIFKIVILRNHSKQLRLACGLMQHVFVVNIRCLKVVL